MSLQRCEGANLESVLEEVRTRFGDTVTIIEANRLRKGGVGGFFAKERFEVVVDVEDSSVLTELPADYGVEATENFCERLLTMADGVSDLEQLPPISTEQPEFSAVLESITRHMEAEPPPAPIKAAFDARALARIGLPDDIRRAAASTRAPVSGADPSAWLLGLLSDLPEAPRLPQTPGSVIVVAGDRDAALLLVRQITAELRLDPDSPVLASPDYRGRAIPAERHITGVKAAAEARRSWRRRRPTVVAVDAPMGRSCEWARRIIDALEPTMVWAAVDATRKPEDLFDWSEQLGGFDALAVSHLDHTVSPAAVLRCGIPVARLEGRPATPLLWASLLAARLAA